jgi:hypothetical protein
MSGCLARRTIPNLTPLPVGPKWLDFPGLYSYPRQRTGGRREGRRVRAPPLVEGCKCLVGSPVCNREFSARSERGRAGVLSVKAVNGN